jgi:hypothetical protein
MPWKNFQDLRLRTGRPGIQIGSGRGMLEDERIVLAGPLSLDPLGAQK